MSMDNMTCKVCHKNYHSCSSCSPEDYWKDMYYCSERCMEIETKGDRLTNVLVQETNNMETAVSIAKRLRDNMKDLPPKYAELIDKYFWELI